MVAIDIVVVLVQQHKNDLRLSARLAFNERAKAWPVKVVSKVRITSLGHTLVSAHYMLHRFKLLDFELPRPTKA